MFPRMNICWNFIFTGLYKNIIKKAHSELDLLSGSKMNPFQQKCKKSTFHICACWNNTWRGERSEHREVCARASITLSCKHLYARFALACNSPMSILLEFHFYMTTWFNSNFKDSHKCRSVVSVLFVLLHNWENPFLIIIAVLKNAKSSLGRFGVPQSPI